MLQYGMLSVGGTNWNKVDGSDMLQLKVPSMVNVREIRAIHGVKRLSWQEIHVSYEPLYIRKYKPCQPSIVEVKHEELRLLASRYIIMQNPDSLTFACDSCWLMQLQIIR